MSKTQIVVFFAIIILAEILLPIFTCSEDIPEKVIAYAYILRYKKLRRLIEGLWKNHRDEVVSVFVRKHLEIYDSSIEAAMRLVKAGSYAKSVKLASEAVYGLVSLLKYLSSSFDDKRGHAVRSLEELLVTRYSYLLLRKASLITFIATKLRLNDGLKMVNKVLSLLGKIRRPSLDSPSVRERLRVSTTILEEAERRLFSLYTGNPYISKYLEELYSIENELSGMRTLIFIDDIFLSKQYSKKMALP